MQLRKMQEKGVIKPSKTPMASPVVLVQKKDGSLRFCIEYRALNAVTKADMFQLPWTGDLLHCRSTWSSQICLHTRPGLWILANKCTANWEIFVQKLIAF